MRELQKLKSIMIASVKKNGDKPITLSHLINMINMIEKEANRIDDREDDHGYGFNPDINS
jgi:hypothetical protein